MCTSADGREPDHHGFLYPPSADLADILTPLIANRLTGHEPVLAAVPPPIAVQLHDRLPTTAGLHTTNMGCFIVIPAGYWVIT